MKFRYLCADVALKIREKLRVHILTSLLFYERKRETETIYIVQYSGRIVLEIYGSLSFTEKYRSGGRGGGHLVVHIPKEKHDQSNEINGKREERYSHQRAFQRWKSHRMVIVVIIVTVLVIIRVPLASIWRHTRNKTRLCRMKEAKDGKNLSLRVLARKYIKGSFLLLPISDIKVFSNVSRKSSLPSNDTDCDCKVWWTFFSMSMGKYWNIPSYCLQVWL